MNNNNNKKEKKIKEMYVFPQFLSRKAKFVKTLTKPYLQFGIFFFL